MALIHFAEDPRHMGHVKAATAYKAEPAAFDKLMNGAVEIASAGQQALNGTQSILPRSNARIVAAPMLQEHKHTAGFKHSPDLAQRLLRLGNRAEGPRTDHAIKALVREGQRFRRRLLNGDGKADRCHFPLHR